MPAYSGPIIDVDIHHAWKRDEDIIAYLPKRWQQYARGTRSDSAGSVSRAGMRSPLRPPSFSFASLIGNGGRRRDSFGPDKAVPGSDYGLMRTQLLDHYGYHRGILTHDLGQQGSLLNPDFAAAACQALNDWTIDCWLARDARLAAVVVIPNANPQLAAQEIRRVGAHSQMVGVILAGNPLGRPYGDPVYDPIYAAAAELGLNILVHSSSGSERPSIAIAGGSPAVALTAVPQLEQHATHYVSSLITNGVFEKFPGLSVQITEYGMTWLPSLLWRLDQRYELLRRESAWVRRWPSEYITEHIKLSTQPMIEGPDRSSLIQLLETVDGIEDMLCFSSDYPHVSSDDATYTARLLPKSWLPKVFCDNACKLWGFPQPANPAAVAETSPATA
jgi:predicted TIM-barrel fold metal-dependent hydrolase